jgi:hypothetical protein
MLRVRLNLLFVLLAAVGAGCQGESGVEVKSGQTASSGTEATSATDRPRAVAKRLGPAPTGCVGPAPHLHSFGDYGNLAGRSPVWAGFYATFDPAGQRYRLERDAPRTEHGWRVKVLWVVGPELGEPARLRGREAESGVALSFDVEDQGVGPTKSGTLDPSQPGVPPTGDYKEFPSYLYIPQAGCYVLEVEWPEGRWRLVIGLGR